MYGPGDGANKFIPKLIDSAKKNYQDNLKLSPGFQVRDFIFVEDVVDAIILLMENYDRILDKYQEIQVGTGIPTNLRSLADKINQILGIKAAPPFDQIPYAENEIMHSIADVSFLKSAGWVHKHSLQDGLKKTIDFN
jgi:nucleoside-diphosphate-sugar epimerase